MNMKTNTVSVWTETCFQSSFIWLVLFRNDLIKHANKYKKCDSLDSNQANVLNQLDSTGSDGLRRSQWDVVKKLGF